MYTLSCFFPSFKAFSCSVYDSNSLFLTYIQTFQKTGKVIWYSHFLKNFPQFVVVLYVKGSTIISEADRNVFWDSLAFSMIQWILSIWSLVLQTSLYIWKFSVHVVLKLSLKDFEHYLASKWDECNCMIGWTFLWNCLSFGLEWKLTFPSTVATAEFSKFADILNAAVLQPHSLGFLNGSAGIPSPLLSLFVVLFP